MTKEKQRIAIAKACGWEQGTIERIFGQPDRLVNERWSWTPPNGWLQSDSPFARAYRNDRESGVISPPNYPGDLNAMNEAEKSLDDEQLKTYRLELMLRVGGHIHFCATATQRAEAFLRTLNLWQE